MTQEQYADAYSRGFDVTKRFLVSHGVSGDTAEEAAQAAWARGANVATSYATRSDS